MAKKFLFTFFARKIVYKKNSHFLPKNWLRNFYTDFFSKNYQQKFLLPFSLEKSPKRIFKFVSNRKIAHKKSALSFSLEKYPTKHFPHFQYDFFIKELNILTKSTNIKKFPPLQRAEKLIAACKCFWGIANAQQWTEFLPVLATILDFSESYSSGKTKKINVSLQQRFVPSFFQP